MGGRLPILSTGCRCQASCWGEELTGQRALSCCDERSTEASIRVTVLYYLFLKIAMLFINPMIQDTQLAVSVGIAIPRLRRRVDAASTSAVLR
jgi:hypothetical protein